MRRVTSRIGAALVEKFARLQVRYVRHYRPYVDLPWQIVFQTEDRSEVAEFCSRHDIAHEWLDEETLRTVQRCQGVARHPVTNETVFFNQAHLFHPSSLGAASAAGLLELFGADRLPRSACFGDGSEITDEELAVVRAAFEREVIVFSWQKGDVLLLDNMRFAHGRRPFTGNRKVLAGLCRSHSPAAR